DERLLEFDSGKVDKVLRVFELKGEEGLGDLGLSKLSIKENEDRGDGIVSMEEWVGPANAVEGYVPKNRPGSKGKDGKLKKDEKEEVMFNESNFTSSIITQGDEYNISKKPSGGQTKMNKKHTQFNDGKESKVGSKVKDGKQKREEKKEEGMFNELNFMSSIITQGDEYSISKEPSGQTQTNKKHTQFNDKEESKVGEPSGDGVDQPSSSSGLKSCLKSKPCSARRNVTWADDDRQASENEQEKDKGILEDPLPAAEVCAQAEAHDVASGDVVPVSDAGPVSGAVIPEPAQIKWPKKNGIVESDFFDSEDSWFDNTPEEFVVDLSPFATMFMSLFAWVSSSTLAYVYGGEDSFAYASVNGREYPQKIVLTDGRSSEIKQTLAACLARALPGLVLRLRIPTPVSTIEYGMGCLLETMSFMDPLPALRTKQWHVILLLFLETLSVSRIPALAPHLTISVFYKVFQDGQISREEYEVLKDLILPLGRFGMQSGA
ncbi:hypothetical protein M8C21_031233, partial [Ambrosia artemisiifolia]